MVTEQGLRDIAAEGNVSADPAVLDSYASDQSFVSGMRPQFVVKATSGEVVQQLVQLAKETETPLVPVSSGGPHFYGDTVPSVGDAVILDLSGLKRVDLIDRVDRVASCIGAGVTFGELIPAVAKEGMCLNMPLQPRATKSVVGSMLSRDPVIMPHHHWDNSDPIGSTEVIFGTGDLFRTGSAAGPGSIEEQRASGGKQKEAAGPSAASWHRVLQGAQGTMGVVTWASALLQVLPEREKPYFVAGDDLSKLLEAVHWLVRLRLGNECLIVDGNELAALMSAEGKTAATLATRLPRWILLFNLVANQYLPDMKMEGQTKDMLELMQRIGLQTVESVGGISAREFLEAIRHPSAEPYWKLRPQGACQDIFFLTTYNKIPGLVKLMTELAAAAGYQCGKMGVYLQPIVQGSSCHVEFSLFYDPADSAQLGAVRKLAMSVVDPLMASGAFFSRPFGEAARQIMNRDAATVETFKKVKAIVDPAGILNPGKLCF